MYSLGIFVVTDFIFFQVMASKTKIYFVLEFVTGGELFDKIVSFQFIEHVFFFLMLCRHEILSEAV